LPELVVAGAGMAGLVAAARARELGASVTLLEKGDRPGGSFLYSSAVVWRYRDWDTFRAQCPGGDLQLQRAVFERLDDSLAWLESLGAPIVSRDTGNPMTTGVRLDPAATVEALARATGEIELRTPLRTLPAAPVLLATGGFQGSPELVRRYVTTEATSLRLRANPWSTGDGLRLALEHGASLSDGMGEFYGRNMAAAPEIPPERFVELAQLYARYAKVTNAEGEEFVTRHWAELDVVQWTARQPRARAWYQVTDGALSRHVRGRTVGEMIEAGRSAGAPVERRNGTLIVEVVTGITTTLGGLKIDDRARAAEGVFAAGADVGGVSTGGYASGLASALVFGKIAAEEAVRPS
jgi:succinate dehydrogenase/fumarate reductase flavoprotein subunit